VEAGIPIRSSEEIIRDILSSEEYNTFFSVMESKHKQLLFLHKYDLFGDDANPQCFYLTDVNKTMKQPRTLRHIISKEASNVARNSITNKLIDEKLIENLKDIISYTIISLIRTNENLKN